MRVLFYEPNHTGHHFAYFARMLPSFLELPIDIGLATTKEALDSEEYKRTLSRFSNQIEVLPICVPPPKGTLRNATHRCRELAFAKQSWNADHVCVLYGDGLWQVAIGAQLLGLQLMGPKVPTEAWMYRGGFSYPSARGIANSAKRFLFQQLLKRGLFDRIHFDDELLLQFVETLPPSNTKVLLTPNPIQFGEQPSQSAAREALKLPSEGRLVSSSGMIARWKGAHLALEAFARAFPHAESQGAPTRLLLAGPHEDEIQQLCQQAPYATLVEQERVILMNRYLGEGEMLQVAAASDLVLAPYPNHSGRSSIILWAASAGRPVLGVNRGCIDYVIRQERLGSTCNVRDMDEFAAAMREGLAAPWTEQDVQRVRTYARWHSIENYGRLSSEYVRSRLELGDQSNEA